MKKCFFGTTWIVICLTYTHFQSHTILLAVNKKVRPFGRAIGDVHIVINLFISDYYKKRGNNSLRFSWKSEAFASSYMHLIQFKSLKSSRRQWCVIGLQRAQDLNLPVPACYVPTSLCLFHSTFVSYTHLNNRLQFNKQ